jgi:hypothetical protein
MRSRYFLAGALLAIAVPVSAQTVWTDWTSATAGNATGSAAGTLNGIGVSYSGEVLSNRVINGTPTVSASPNVWAPATSFIGGTVTTSPAVPGDIITLNGSFTGTNTLTFASPITNPVFAIWSLGQPGASASFTFNVTPTKEAGGPNRDYGGSSIVVTGNVVSGSEGNGTVQFTGTFSSLSWTDTVENYYGFTVGMAGPSAAPIPEPSTWALLGVGLVALGLRARRRA